MDPAKVEAVLKWPTPKKLKELQAFLEFANFYCHFILNFSYEVNLLTHLMRKDTVWQ